MKIEKEYEIKLDEVKKETLAYISSLVNKYSKEEIKILIRSKLVAIKKDHLIDMFFYWIEEYYKDFYCHTEYSTPEERRQLREYYTEQYLNKAEEVTGSKYYADGKPKLPMFNRKENMQIIRLFKMFGMQTLKNMIVIFFSDSIDHIREFTRGKKAGYGFSVFYSMIPKLSTIPGVDNVPCEKCGGILKHAYDCEKSFVKLKEAEYKEIRAEKVDVDLVGDFWKTVGKETANES